jgi:hypothetical protein
MSMKSSTRWFPRQAILMLGLLPASAWALVMVSQQGNWPTDWPAELEPLRKQAKSIAVATGVQQDIHQILFRNRAEFERAWPVILKLKAPNAPITLYSTNTPAPKSWGSDLDNEHASVRIYAPPEGLFSTNTTGNTGSLPEYVIRSKDTNAVHWIPVDLAKEIKNPSGPIGFIFRRRIDLDLIVDPQIVDLTRLSLPSGTEVRDARFPMPDLNPQLRSNIIQEAQQSYSRHVRVPAKERTTDIPARTWGPTIASLKPVRLIDDRVNIRVVLFDGDGMEAGLFIQQPISSYAPDPDDFLEFIPLNRPEDQTFGQIYRYKLVQSQPKPKK